MSSSPAIAHFLFKLLERQKKETSQRGAHTAVQ